MKKIISFGVCIALVLGSFGMVFAADPMDFKGTPANLSLASAIKVMTTEGPGYKAAEFTKMSYETAALGQTEMLSSIRKANEKMGGSGYGKDPIVGTAQRDIAFYKKVAPIQFQADLNGLESVAISAYYGVLQAEDYVKVCADDLKVQNDIFYNVKKKFELGMAAKIDLISAEGAMVTSKDVLEKAETSLIKAKMAFNVQMGYDVMKNLNFTDKLVKRQPSALRLNTDLEKAKQNRVELVMTDYNLESAKIDMQTIQYRYPANSATYNIKALDFMKAEKTKKDTLAGIEMDVRSKYMAIIDTARSVSVAESVLLNTKEGYRIAQITYNAGMNILADVQAAQVRVSQAQLGLSKAMADYDLAVYAYAYATGAGTSSGAAQ